MWIPMVRWLQRPALAVLGVDVLIELRCVLDLQVCAIPFQPLAGSGGPGRPAARSRSVGRRSRSSRPAAGRPCRPGAILRNGRASASWSWGPVFACSCSATGSTSGMPPCEPWYILPFDCRRRGRRCRASGGPAGISAGVGGISPPSYQVIRTGGSGPRGGKLESDDRGDRIGLEVRLVAVEE